MWACWTWPLEALTILHKLKKKAPILIIFLSTSKQPDLIQPRVLQRLNEKSNQNKLEQTPNHYAKSTKALKAKLVLSTWRVEWSLIGVPIPKFEEPS